MNPHAGQPFTDTDDEIAAHLEDVSIPTLLVSLVHLTGDPSWIRGEIRPTGLMLNEYQTIGMSEQEYVRWNERCDGCDRHFPNSDGLLYCNAMRTLDQSYVCITFAACLDCLAKP